MRNIWVLCGGPTTEHQVSLKSARVICQRIGLGHQRVRPVAVTMDGLWLIPEQEIATEADRAWADEFLATVSSASCCLPTSNIGEALTRMLAEGVDCVFLAIHGQWGEDGRIQGFLQAANMAFTGSGLLASATAFNKMLTLEAYRREGLRTPHGVVVADLERDLPRAAELELPVFVKPVRGGSSVGMTFVHESAKLGEALRLALSVDTLALVEEQVVGVEVSCGVMDLVRDGAIVSTAMPPTEIRPVGSEYFDYDAKYTPGRSREITPAELPADIVEQIQRAALLAHRTLGCEGMSRTDMIVPHTGDRTPVLLETNTIPGMTATSLLPQQAQCYGLSLPEFFDALIEHALLRSNQGNAAAAEAAV